MEQLVTQEQATQIHKDVQRIVREVAEEGGRPDGGSCSGCWCYWSSWPGCCSGTLGP